jgi:hypothetical protein
MEVSGQLHAPAALPPGKQPPVLAVYEVMEKKINLAPVGIISRLLGRPTGSLVAIPTDLSLRPSNIAYGFTESEISLFNRNVFTGDDDFAATLVTDGPRPNVCREGTQEINGTAKKQICRLWQPLRGLQYLRQC